MNLRFKNTLQKGSVRYIVFREGKGWYAAALEFNIVESGDDPREAMHLLFEAIEGYLKSFAKSKARPHMLNQEPDPEYEKLWKSLTMPSAKAMKSPYAVYAFGERSLKTT